MKVEVKKGPTRQRKILGYSFKLQSNATIIRSEQDAEVVGRKLVEMRSRGAVTPQAIVEEARRRTSPLHKYFEWDDGRAAEKWRTHQARLLIHDVDIEIRYEGGVQREVKAFHSVVANGGRAYEVATTVFSRTELADQIIASARRELEGWIRRYGQYESLAVMTRHVQQALTVTAKTTPARRATGRVRARAAA